MPGPLLRCLAAAHPRPLRRDELIAAVYADQPISSARNRLRVALTRLRRIAPLREEGDAIGLDLEPDQIDVAEVRGRVRDSELEPDADAEARALEAVLPQLGQVLFPDAGTAWEVEAQAAWGLEASRALDRLGGLAEQRMDLTLALAAAEGSLIHFPYEAASWERYLRAMARLGRGPEAVRRVAAARRQAKVDGWPFPEQLTDPGALPYLSKAGSAATLPTTAADGEDPLGPDLSPGESLALERFFRRTLVAQPELAVEMLGSSAFRPEVLRAPAAVLPLLREALALPVPPSEARERIQVRVITALSLLEESQAVLVEAERFLAQPVAPARRRIALLNASFCHALQGDLPSAVASVEEAMALATGPNAEYDVHECRAQRATFAMMAGDLGSAEAELRAAIRYLESHPQAGADPDLLAIRGNLGLCLVHRSRRQEAVGVLRPVIETARVRGLAVPLALFAPVLAFALGEPSGDVGRLLVEGLRAAYRISPRRATTAAGYAGRALLECGADPSATILLEALTIRRGQGPPLHALEADLYAPVLDQRPVASRPLVEFVRGTIRATVCAIADA